MGCEQSTAKKPNTNSPFENHQHEKIQQQNQNLLQASQDSYNTTNNSTNTRSLQGNKEVDELLVCHTKGPDTDTLSSLPPNGMNKGVPRLIGSYEVTGYLGKGTWATVHECQHQGTGTRFAVKSFNKKKVDRNNLDYTARREIRILKQLKDHTNIVGLRDVVEDRIWLHMIVDLGGRDMQDVLNKCPMTEAQAKTAFKEMMIAVKYIHNHKICHRDLKPSNLLIGGGKVMLTDFGLGEILKSSNSTLSEICGTPDFIAPEVISQAGYNGQKADIWSSGVTLYVMLFSRPPWAGASSKFKHKQIANANYKSPKLQRYSKELNNLLELLFQLKPENRPSASQVLAHPWLQTPAKTVYL
eukprot:TRINITY_DN3439_c0_g2_i1.p1 TRINITY_DN3439_c0_g2~~TRINITY_DN3439_c0_g2_i1.p1  ORF type:complete len:391 (+),score=56.76 TRINITY_DN3439_c0_g2_i1:108-1175(+)